MPLKNDGTVQYGSRVLTIGSAAGGSGGVAYVGENCQVTRPTFVIERRSEINAPNGQLVDSDFVTGSATLQMSGAVAEPQNGFEFTITWDSAIGSEIFFLSNVTRSENQGDAKKFNVEFRKKIN